MSETTLTADEIGEVRHRLAVKVTREALSVTEQNMLRDCDIALGEVECKPEAREEARARVTRMVQS